jgi:hypothetical protein
MKPYKIQIYVYAENDQQAEQVAQSAKAFVKKKYEQGILITADKLSAALNRFADNFIVNQYFK